MFKASIALVLIAFAALAYGWVADNDAILYGSIGASILAGLLLLRATMADRKAYPQPGRAERPERPAREPREPKASSKSEADYPPPGSRSRRGGKGRPDSGEMTRQLGIPGDAEDFLGADSEEATPFRPQSRRRERLPSVPEGAAWAGRDEDDDYQEAGGEFGDRAGGPSSAGELDQDESQPAAASPGGASPADDFRSRLAAVLGSTGEEIPPPSAPAQRTRRAAPRPVPLDDDEDDDEAPAAAAQRTRRTAPRTTPEAETQPEAPKRRGRKKASEPVLAAEPEPGEGEDGDGPEWVRVEDGPQASRVIQPGGGFARPDVPEEITHYRPRRPAVASTSPEPEPEPAKAPAPRKRRSPDEPAVSKVRSAGAKPASRQSSGLTRVSPAEKTRSKAAKDRDPDAPPPRRGRPPKPKP